MLFSFCPVVIRGGGDLGTGVASRLWKGGFPVLILERDPPLAVRVGASAAGAVLEGTCAVEDLRFRRIGDPREIGESITNGEIPVMVCPALPPLDSLPFPRSEAFLTRAVIPVSGLIGPIPDSRPPVPRILVDARMRKETADTNVSQASFVVALGPGHAAGSDCHAVIETMRGHTLGRVVWSGSAMPDTGTPARMEGRGSERVLRAPREGTVRWNRSIGDAVSQGEFLGEVEAEAIAAPFAGILRGRIADGSRVSSGMKIGDIDPRAKREACFTISDKALAVGGGVLEAVLTWLGGHREAFS